MFSFVSAKVLSTLSLLVDFLRLYYMTDLSADGGFGVDAENEPVLVGEDGMTVGKTLFFFSFVFVGACFLMGRVSENARRIDESVLDAGSPVAS